MTKRLHEQAGGMGDFSLAEEISILYSISESDLPREPWRLENAQKVLEVLSGNPETSDILSEDLVFISFVGDNVVVDVSHFQFYGPKIRRVLSGVDAKWTLKTDAIVPR